MDYFLCLIYVNNYSSTYIILFTPIWWFDLSQIPPKSEAQWVSMVDTLIRVTALKTVLKPSGFKGKAVFMFPRNLRGWSPDSKEDGSNVIQNHIVHLCHGKMGEQCQTTYFHVKSIQIPCANIMANLTLKKNKIKTTYWNPPSPPKKIEKNNI